MTKTNPSSSESIEYARIRGVLETLPDEQRELIMNCAQYLMDSVNARGHSMSLNGALHAIERVGQVLAGERWRR